MMTKMVATIIQAVSPLLGTRAGAASAAAGAAAGAGAVAGVAASALASALASTLASAAGAVCANAAPPKHKLSPKAREANNFFIQISLSGTSKGFSPSFAGANADNLFQVVHKHFAVANFAGACASFNGFNHALNLVV